MKGNTRADAPAQDARSTAALNTSTYVVVYRSVLHSESRFRTVGKDAQLAFFTLKLLMTCENIGRHVSWPAEISDNCALTEDEARAALEELRAAGMIQWDGRVLWIVQGLAHDPSMRGTLSGTFAMGIIGRVRNLPDCAIVRAFKEHYAHVLAAADAERAKRTKGGALPPSPLDTPPVEASREASGVRVYSAGVGVSSSTPKQKKSVDPAQPKKPRQSREHRLLNSAAGRSTWVVSLHALLCSKLGAVSADTVESHFSSLVAQHGEETVLAVAQWFFEDGNTPPRYWSLNNLSGRFGAHLAAMEADGEEVNGSTPDDGVEVVTTFCL